jgi:hypothetical protein
MTSESDAGRRTEIQRRHFMEKLRQLQAASPGQVLPNFPDRAWERLRYKGMKLRDWLVQSRPESHRPPTRMIAEIEWSTFKKFCAAEGNWLPWVIFHLGPQHTGMFKRRRPGCPKGSDPFEDLPETFRSKARMIFERLCKKWAWDLPAWRKAILVGRARRLATHPPDSNWGRRMLAKRGGYAIQEKYRQQGHHPLGLVLPKKSKP